MKDHTFENYMNFQASNLRFICKYGWKTMNLKT